MAYSATERLTESSTSEPMTTGSFTTTLDVPNLVSVHGFNDGPQVPAVPSLSKTGTSWTTEVSVAFTDGVAFNSRISLHSTVPTSTDSGTMTVTISGNAPEAICVKSSDQSEVGSGFVVQAVAASGGSGTAMSVTLSAFADDVNNGLIVFGASFVDASTPTISASGFTEFGDETELSDAVVLEGAWKVGEDLTPDMTLSESGFWGMIAAELDHDAGITEHTASPTDGVSFDDTPLAAVGVGVSDGVSFDDTPAALVAFVPAVTDGVAFDDTPLAAVATAVEDGVEFDDTPTFPGGKFASPVDGFSVDDSLQLGVAVGVIDAVEFGDLLAAVAGAPVVDGVAFDDTPVALVAFAPAVTDGVAFDDTPVATVAALVSVTDGVAFDEDITTTVDTRGSATPDGVAFDDTPLAAVAVAVEDGVEFDDTPIFSGAQTASPVDGFTVDDSLQLGVAVGVVDSVEFGDLLGVASGEAVADGVSFDDTALAAVGVGVTDGVAFDDAVSLFTAVLLLAPDVQSAPPRQLRAGAPVRTFRVDAPVRSSRTDD